MTDSSQPPVLASTPHFTMYTTAWCHHCLQAKDWLKRHGLEPGRDFTEINIEENPDAAAEVERLNDGYRTVPTILMPDGHSYHEPTPNQLAEIFPSLK